ncbi:glycine cleavage system aminomethyltransferase GcvT [Methylogaea oryzae]|uniref:Aminomethyltransferase n=1 Tax=Methylogaea oryzae TaxID=1295382 RepID=A0A8D4VNE7_9GAMM|nr:glycine cleavage system aminomethyltransferase GcvT [Methylogaea oryzae]BBL71088.1 aminomethyltransferase [Methylogaea oryzae]
MLNKTALHERHRALNGHMVPFAGWDMPLHYGSQIAEHHRVRTAAGAFDVSHMTLLDIRGAEAKALLRRLLSNDVDRLKQSGQALYGCLLNERGGVVDDVIVYLLDDAWLRMVSNAATRDHVTAWLAQHSHGRQVSIAPRADLAIVAVQGPQSPQLMRRLLPQSGDFNAQAADLAGFRSLRQGEWQVARTGYTGEVGYEVLLPLEAAGPFWDALMEAGVQPCGLAARDTLRLEAGMRLYGVDMDETVTPLQCGLESAVAWQPEDRDFIGRAALQRQKAAGGLPRFAGLVLAEKGVLRNGLKVKCDGGEGVITSGGYSPTLQKGIALARLPAQCQGFCQVELRGRWLTAHIVPPSFVRHGKARVPST